jgi:hypothetical protein
MVAVRTMEECRPPFMPPAARRCTAAAAATSSRGDAVRPNVGRYRNGERTSVLPPAIVPGPTRPQSRPGRFAATAPRNLMTNLDFVILGTEA